MHLSTTLSQILTFVLLVLPLATFSYPVNSTHVLEARGTCGDGGESPCICNDALGLRLNKLTCSQIGFHFVNPNDPTDGTLKEVTGTASSVGKLQCDHVVELQFIAQQIAQKPGICTHFLANPADFRTFFDTINDKDNLVFVEDIVNGAKAVPFRDAQFRDTNEKAAKGVVSYLNLLKKRTSVPSVDGGAKVIGDKLNSLVGATNGIPGFQAAFIAKVNTVIARVQTQVDSGTLGPAPAPGDPFVDQTASTIAKCKGKRTMWEEVKALVVRATTGKKTPPPAASCALPAKSTKATKTSTSSAGKATSKSTSKSTGKVTVKKTAPKKTAPKKTAPKKTAPKKTAPKKTAPKKTAPKKTAPKKTVVKKVPVKRPVAKKPVRS